MNDKNIMDLLNEIDILYKRKNNIEALLKLINKQNISIPNISSPKISSPNISPQTNITPIIGHIKIDTPNIDSNEKYKFIDEVRDNKGKIMSEAKIIINNKPIYAIKYDDDFRVTAKEYNSLMLLDDYEILQKNEPFKLFLTGNLIYLICNELKKLLQYNDKIVLIDPDLLALIIYSEEDQNIIRTEDGTGELYRNFINSPYPYFFIVNNDPEGGHWMAVVLYKNDKFDTKYYIFDSGGYINDKPRVIRDDEIISRLLTYFIPGYNPTEALIDKNSPRIHQQKNSWECGYAVCSILKKMILFGKDNKTTNYDEFDNKIKENPNEFFNIGNYKMHRGLLLGELNTLIKNNKIISGGNKNYKYKHDKYKQKYLSIKNI